MKLFCLLATLALVRAQGYGEDYGYTIEDIRGLADALESALIEVNANISDLTTGTASSQGRINDINDFFLPNINLLNAQQSALLEDYTAQIKALQHRVDEARAQEQATQDLQGSIAEALDEQAAQLNATADVNGEQANTISGLEGDVNQTKTTFLSDLVSAIEGLNEDLDDVENKTGVLATFVDDRRCEYGTGAFSPDTDTRITFTTPFDVPPSVTIAVTGFETNLDAHSYDHYDGLSLDKYASNITATGFTVSTKDISEGMVELTRVYCSYMACQGFEDQVAIVHP